MTARRGRALEVARRLGTDGVLAADVGTVAWLTGFEADIESGPSPFALPPLAVVTPDGPPVLVVSEDDRPRVPPDCEACLYVGFTIEELDLAGRASRALQDAAGSRRLATESGALSSALARGLSLVDATTELRSARAVKGRDEIGLLRAAVELCDVGQAEARTHVQPGISEIELWAQVRGAMEHAAGGRIPLLADLASGPRTAATGGAPGPRVLADGDLVICDLVPRLKGYWGDSCATLAVGEPAASARSKHRAAADALERGIEAVRPGVVAGDLDELMRKGLDYPHHSGHGLGTSWHEEPRIVPGGRTRLEPGMVLALEPGVYDDAEGVRLEQVVVVTEDGCTTLSNHSLEL